MHPRTRKDLAAIRPLCFAPMQTIRNGDGDTFERRGDGFHPCGAASAGDAPPESLPGVHSTILLELAAGFLGLMLLAWAFGMFFGWGR